MTLRPGGPDDVEPLRAILAEPTVTTWWGTPKPTGTIAAKLGGGQPVLLVIEIGGQVAGGIQYHEERDPTYFHAGIDIYLTAGQQGHGAGPEAIALLAEFLFDRRGHHRITIDPALANHRAIASYRKAGFRPVGVLRQYERGPDGQLRDGLLMELLRTDLIDSPPIPRPADCAREGRWPCARE